MVEVERMFHRLIDSHEKYIWQDAIYRIMTLGHLARSNIDERFDKDQENCDYLSKCE
jgi:hypothetical protein